MKQKFLATNNYCGTREDLEGFLGFVESFTAQAIITVGMDERYRFYEVCENRVNFLYQIEEDEPHVVAGWADFKPVVQPAGHTIVINVYASDSANHLVSIAADRWKFLAESWNEYLRFLEKKSNDSALIIAGEVEKEASSVSAAFKGVIHRIQSTTVSGHSAAYTVALKELIVALWALHPAYRGVGAGARSMAAETLGSLVSLATDLSPASGPLVRKICEDAVSCRQRMAEKKPNLDRHKAFRDEINVAGWTWELARVDPFFVGERTLAEWKRDVMSLRNRFPDKGG